MDIGKTIAKLRCDLELSQEKFANLLGVSRQTRPKMGVRRIVTGYGKFGRDCK